MTDWPLFSVIMMVAWQWLPFATLIFITALQSHEPRAAGGRAHGRRELPAAAALPLRCRTSGRSIAVVIMIEMIFLLSVFAEIFTTTGGGPGDASTNSRS